VVVLALLRAHDTGNRWLMFICSKAFMQRLARREWEEIRAAKFLDRSICSSRLWTIVGRRLLAVLALVMIHDDIFWHNFICFEVEVAAVVVVVAVTHDDGFPEFTS